MLGRVWKIIAESVDGLKTLIVAGVFVLLGLAEYTEAVNLQPVFEWLFGENVAAKIMMFMPVVFGTLRFLSNGGVKWTPSWRKEKVEEDGRGHSTVDVPEGEDK